MNDERYERMNAYLYLLVLSLSQMPTIHNTIKHPMYNKSSMPQSYDFLFK